MRTELPAVAATIGHNSGNPTVSIEARLFNILVRFGPEDVLFHTLSFQAGSTVRDLIQKPELPVSEIFLVLRNGRDISSGIVVRRLILKRSWMMVT